jgi:pyrimidine-nucleoside phosphorylase
MRSVDIIIKKRDKVELTRQEIEFFVRGYTQGEITDYQAAAWAMAVLLNGMTDQETTDLTMAMANSGQVLDLSDIVDIVVDKHSTGGVGDKTSLAVMPMVAAAGLYCGKMSGRGLGFSGGTLDKLESIPGYRVDLSTEEFRAQLRKTGIVLTGQSLDLAPADGKFYALRDVTGTVPSIPLIASSIMSKKIASGATAIVLDVKVGLGAFMETLEEARKLASILRNIGKLAGRQVVTILSDMNQPLGFAVGNALELKEAIDTLQGAGPADFRHHCIDAAAKMLLLGEKAPTMQAAIQLAEQTITNGSALEKLRVLIDAQGGDTSYITDPNKLPKARLIETVASPQTGYLSQVHARVIGEASVNLGAGRAKKSDPIDHAVGFEILGKVGDHVEQGQPLFILHANDPQKLQQARSAVLSAHQFSPTPVPPLPLFYEQ